MENNIRNRVLDYVYNNGLIEKGDKIIVGVSGGPDSICLLHILYKLRKEMNIDLAAVHINHMLRGEEADKDEEYVKEFCDKLDIKFFSKKININAMAKDNGISSETAGREARYSYFNEVMDDIGFNKIATAHNANDQAETIIMRIMRGTGLEGLGGIPVKRENKYIRPILFLNRQDIEAYCNNNNLKPRIDATNLETVYSRNKVRLDILPYMKENFNPDIVETINRMAMLLQEDNNFIEEKVLEYFEKFCKRNDDYICIDKALFNYKSSIVNRVIRKSISEISGSSYDLELKHVQEIVKLSKLGTNKKINLPNHIYAENIYDDIYLKNKNSVQSNEDKVLHIKKGDILNREVEFENYILRFELIANEKNINFNNNSLIKYFNYDKINGNIIIRHRKNGDKIVPLGMNGSKKVKDIFIDMKIPQDERGNIPIVQFGDDIGWIIGVKVSDKYKVTNDTINILKLTSERKEL